MATKKKKVKKVAKKKLSDLFAIRSKAAKKGWKTRKRNEKINPKIKSKKKAGKRPKVKTKKPKIKKYTAKTPNLRPLEKKTKKELRQIIELYEMTAGWVNAAPAEYTSYDGHICVSPSRARHLGKATSECLKLLRKADLKGADVLHAEATRIALILELPIKEIYTLFFSP